MIGTLCAVCFVFFFQAEDGIRDLVRSRGLGDVYKRQAQNLRPAAVTAARIRVVQERIALVAANRTLGRAGHDPHAAVPVSYTHLTLPTSDLV